MVSGEDKAAVYEWIGKVREIGSVWLNVKVVILHRQIDVKLIFCDMENISWSEEQVLAVVNEFNDKMEELRKQAPKFQHIDFVKLALLYLKREHISSDWQLTEENDKAAKILKHLAVDLSDNTSELKINGIELKKIIQQVYSDTIGGIPYNEYAKNYLEIMKKLYKNVFSRGDAHSPLDSYFETIHDKEVPVQELFIDDDYFIKKYPGRVIYIKGFDTLLSLMSQETNGFWDNTITCDFDNLDDLYFFEMLNSDIEMKSYGTTLLFGPKISEKKLKYDIYLDYDFDFSKAPFIFEKLNTNGYIIAGVSDTEIDGKNEDLRRLFDNGQVKRVHYVDVEDSDWVEIVPRKNNTSGNVCFYDPRNGLKSHEIDSETIIRYGYSLDLSKYDAFEKIDEFITSLTNLKDALGYGIGYDDYMASLFLIPYFKMNYEDVLTKLIDDFDLNYDKIVEDCINDEDVPEKVNVVRALSYCVSEMRDREYITDAKYQQYLNAIRLINSIDNHAFHEYYHEIIGRICENTILPLYPSLYQFVESQLENTDNLQIIIRKKDTADIRYPEDGDIEEQTSYPGWGSLVTPNIFTVHNVNVEMDFHLTGDSLVAAQYIIFDALDDEDKTQHVYDIKLSSDVVADIIIDLHKDVRQYEQLKKRLNPGGQYVTFAMKKDMDACHPVIEHLIKENLLEKVVSLNNRYLLFINQNKQDDKVVLAKFNHIDDDRWLQSYQTIIDELALKADTKHIRILSSDELAATNYSISTDSYFTTESSQNIESVIRSLIARHNDKYNAIDILLYVLSRVGHLHRFGEEFPYYAKRIEKLDGVYDSMLDYEELLMDNYTECVNTVIQIYGSEVLAHEHFQPGISKLMVDTLSPDSIHNVYNPFAGLASFCYLIPHAAYFGSEIDENVFTFAAYRLEANGLYDQAMFECVDSTIDDADDVAPFDTILTILPFMIKNETCLYDYLFGKCFSMLEENGKMMVALPSKFTFDKSSAMTELRKKIVENKWVEKVICLPKGAFKGTNVNTCLIQLSKRANPEILFCDATQMVEYDKGKETIQMEAIVSAINQEGRTYCFKVPNSEVVENNYSLNLFAYKPFPSEEGTIQCQLQDFLTKIKRDRASSLSKGLLFTQDMLSSDVVNYRKGLGDLKIGSVSESMMKLQGNALIVSSVQSNLKPTYLEVGEDTCYYMNRGLLAFKVDTTKVLPGYICHALTRPEILRQIDNYRIGVMANIFSEDFLNIRINLPDLSTQRVIVDDLAREQYAKKKQELKKMYGDVYAEKEEEFKSLKHAMGKSLAGINAAVDNLYNYFEKTGLLDKIVQTRRNTTVADKLNVIKDSIRHIEILMQNGADFLDVSQYPLSSVSISEIWSNIQYENEKFTVDKSEILPQSMSEVSVRMNLDLFKILINDVMSNAEKHAFFDNDPANVVRVEISSDNAWLTLLISNNGEPFPKDVDVQKFTKRYWSAGKCQGSGIGGHDIQKIMKACQGEFELITDYKETFPTCYVLRFPIE